MESLIIWLKYTFLGLLQGFTEPIPISSSGHLIIAQHLFGMEIEGLSFEVLVNFASLIAVIVIYRADVIRLTVHSWNYLRTKDDTYRTDFIFVVFLIIATIPAAVIGLLFNDWIGSQLKGMITIGVTLLLTGVALWIIRNLRGSKNDGALTFKDALIIGLVQAVALIPGVSRSGATIIAGMLRGLKQETALRFSFLMYIPVSLGGMVLETKEILNDPNLNELIGPYIIAFLGALIASYFALKWFMGIMARGNLKIFSFYCFIVGISVLLFLR